jgi:hypothetical protein
MTRKRRPVAVGILTFVTSLSPARAQTAPPSPPAEAAPGPDASASPPPPPASPPSAASPSDPAPPTPSGDEGADEGTDADEVTPEGREKPPPTEGEDAAPPGGDERDEEDLGDEHPGRPPPKGKAVIWGVVKETEFNETLVEAPVQVLGKKIEAVTDVEGRYRLELPPGTYDIRVSYELHKSQRVSNLTVVLGQVLRLDAELHPDKAAVDVVEVVEEADKTSLEGLVLARRRAAVVGDSIGRQEIAKSTDRNAAQAAQRVVGATVVGGRFVYVRGLGERYTNALVNGVPLPSPEPDRAAVPLDLFPTGVLNSLTIAKTFTPDMPADFAGGSVRIETREIPSKPLLQLSLRGAYNTNSTFRTRLTHRGGSMDWLGIDSGARALPDGFPTGFIGPGTPPEQATAAGLQLNSYMSAERSGTPPDHGLGVVAGNGWDLGNDRKLGVIGAVSYGRSYTVRRGEILRIFKRNQRGELEPSRDYIADTGNDNVNWGGYGSISYRFSAQHQVTLIGMRSTLADNRTQYLYGHHDVREQDIHATRLAFVTRALNLGILNGEHRFPSAGGSQLNWNLLLSSATRDEPDRRDTVWGRGASGPNYFYTDAPESGRHFFADQGEKQYGGGADYTQPIGPRDTKLKLGALVSTRDRGFTSRSLRFRPLATQTCTAPADFDACNDALFAPGNIGTVIGLEEKTKSGDSYDALLNVYSGYVMADVGVTEQLRVILGERVEHTYQVIDPLPPPGGGEEEERARIRQTDLLPALAAVYALTKKTNVRGSLTRTLARPQLRELAPFTFQDYFGGQVVGGNPDLEMTTITNVDARIEYFPTLKDVLAFSFFYKQFKNPIEPVVLSAGDEGSITFANAPGAKLVGVEFEARRALDFLPRSLQGFGVATNLTLAYSRIQINSGGSLALTNLSRALVNQAPWVFNLALDYLHEKSDTGARLAYNVIGPRIARVGSDGLDDIYEHSRHQLDLTVQKKIVDHLSLKLEGKNLLGSEVLLTQGCGTKGLFSDSWHFSCGRGKDAAVSWYTEGVTVALTGAYEY